MQLPHCLLYTSHPASGHNEQVLIKEAWTEYKPIYETVAIEICDNCKADCTSAPVAHNKEHMLNGKMCIRDSGRTASGGGKEDGKTGVRKILLVGGNMLILVIMMLGVSICLLYTSLRLWDVREAV